MWCVKWTVRSGIEKETIYAGEHRLRQGIGALTVWRSCVLPLVSVGITHWWLIKYWMIMTVTLNLTRYFSLSCGSILWMCDFIRFSIGFLPVINTWWLVHPNHNIQNIYTITNRYWCSPDEDNVLQCLWKKLWIHYLPHYKWKLDKYLSIECTGM